MAFDIVPGRFWNRFPLFDDEDFFPQASTNQNISISEDEKNVYVEAAVPGITPKDVDVTFHKGVLWIKGEKQEEQKDEKKKYYAKAAASFSYRLSVPGEIDANAEPSATVEHGIVKVTFAKVPQSQPKKITVKAQ